MRRRVVLLLLTCAALVLGLDQYLFIPYGPKTIYRGHNVYVAFPAYTSEIESTFTVDPATDIITCADCTGLVNGNPVIFWSTGTLPSPLVERFIGTAGLVVSGLSGNTFQVGWGSDILDFQDTGTGTHYVAHPFFATEIAGRVFLEEVTGLPSGVTYACFQGNANVACLSALDGRGKLLPYVQSTNLILKLTATADAALGLATITVKTYHNVYGNKTKDYTFTVSDVVPLTRADPASSPAMPDVAGWNDFMLWGATSFCLPDNTMPTEGFGAFTSAGDWNVWNYDGAWVYRQVARYTGEPAWNNCAMNISHQYLARVFALGGWMTSYYYWTDGLKAACASGDMRFREAIRLMGRNFYLGTGVVDNGMRETAYGLSAAISFLKSGAGRASDLRPVDKHIVGADLLLGMIDVLVVQGTPIQYQSFMCGLLARALIRYWEYTGDPRVPVAIKSLADWMWTNAWNDTYKKSYWSPWAYGPLCIDTSSAGNPRRCGRLDSELVMIWAPMYAWLFRYTGDTTYQERADAHFKALNKMWAFTGTQAGSWITVPAHGLSDNQLVVIRSPLTGSVPGGTTVNIRYYVRDVSADTFRLTQTYNGDAINLTSDGAGYMVLERVDGVPFTGAAGTDLITINSHGLSEQQPIVVMAPAAGSSLPTGLTSGKVYLTCLVTTNTFRLTADTDPTCLAPIDLTSDGSGYMFLGPYQTPGAKQFSQTYQWGFDYWRWRQGLEPYRP